MAAKKTPETSTGIFNAILLAKEAFKLCLLKFIIFVPEIDLVKKIFSIFLTVIFLAGAMGVTINTHYCGKRLESISFSAGKCCCAKDAPMKKNCCKNNSKFVKITDNYSPSVPFHFSKVEVSTSYLSDSFVPAFSKQLAVPPYNDDSPPLVVEDLVIKFRSILV